MTTAEYRAQLSTMPMRDLISELDRVRADLIARRGASAKDKASILSSWQASQLLAEIGARQLRLI